jgi:hypothetical protein
MPEHNLSLSTIAVITIVRYAANLSVPNDCKKQLYECKNVNSTGHSSPECMEASELVRFVVGKLYLSASKRASLLYITHQNEQNNKDGIN